MGGGDHASTPLVRYRLSGMKVRECKHSYADRDRVLTLLFFEDAEPPKWRTGWEDEEATEMSDGFVRK